MLTEFIGRASEYAIAQNISESAPFHRGDRVHVIAEGGLGDCRVVACDPEHRKVTVVWRTGRAATLLDDEVEAVR